MKLFNSCGRTTQSTRQFITIEELCLATIVLRHNRDAVRSFVSIDSNNCYQSSTLWIRFGRLSPLCSGNLVTQRYSIYKMLFYYSRRVFIFHLHWQYFAMPEVYLTPGLHYSDDLSWAHLTDERLNFIQISIIFWYNRFWRWNIIPKDS